MISKLPHTDRLVDHLLPYFEHKRFGFVEESLQFKRITSFGHVSVVCKLNEADNGPTLSFFVGLRHSLVENAMAGLFGNGAYYRSESHTLLVDHRHIIVPSGALTPPMPLPNMTDLERTCDEFIDFLDNKGFFFFDAYRKLKVLDKFYNDRVLVSEKWCNHQYQRCFRGLIIAGILRRPDLNLVHAQHRAYLLSRGYAGAVVQRFDATFAQIAQMSFN